MKILDTIIVLLASLLGTGQVIRLTKEYIAIGKEIEERKKEKNKQNNRNN